MLRLADLDTGSKAAPSAGDIEDTCKSWLFKQAT